MTYSHSITFKADFVKRSKLAGLRQAFSRCARHCDFDIRIDNSNKTRVIRTKHFGSQNIESAIDFFQLYIGSILNPFQESGFYARKSFVHHGLPLAGKSNHLLATVFGDVKFFA